MNVDEDSNARVMWVVLGVSGLAIYVQTLKDSIQIKSMILSSIPSVCCITLVLITEFIEILEIMNLFCTHFA